LNAEEDPENVDYPKLPGFKERFGSRGVLHSFASDKDDATVDPRFGKVGKHTVEDTGPLTIKPMETVDDDMTKAALGFIEENAKAGKPFFCWWNSSRMHVFTHLSPKWEGKTGLGIEADGMVEHDGDVGKLLDELKKLGIEDNTIVMYSSDNGAESLSWPDGGTTMFRGEKNTPWEGGFRVPTLISWPGVIKPGTIVNDLGAHEDMLPTILAATGDTTVTEDLLKGRKIGDMTYKVHLDGYNLIPFLKGEVKESPRQSFIYWTDDGSVAALRYRDYKVMFLKQNALGLRAWQHPFEELRAPLMTNLRMDPFERAEEENAMGYQRWYIEHMYAFAPAAAYVGGWLQSFREFPPRMKPGSFSLDRVMEAVTAPPKGSN
jgi:arylsulfatase A-like enzyme